MMGKGIICGLLLFLICVSCQDKDTLFTSIDPSHSNIHFNNKIVETDTFNILEYEYIYNGGGIGLGDFNNDGLEDIFAVGNLVPNELYLNQGDFVFKNVSAVSGIQNQNRWGSGVAVLDLNNDGWQDIYVCNTTSKNPKERTNHLFINQGLNENGIPVFEDLAEVYGLNDDSYSVNAAFFDYDNDEDLDVIIIVNEMGDTRYHSQYRDANTRDFYQRVDHFYRNDPLPNGQPYFTDVSADAGITLPGFSLGVNISDINKDGWKDIYISNDFLSDDLIYMNNADGTFTESARDLLKHTSHSAMGNDVVDLNNDGYDEILALDMLPEDNYRQKRLLGETNYNAYLNNERFGYSYQYVRNTLQLNNGIDQDNQPRYSDVALHSGISATDWSWTPLVADFDCDGYRDIIITNGFPRDVTDHDFIDYKADAFTYASKRMMLDQIPSIKLHNYAYRNNGNMTFDEVTQRWGIDQPTYSSGAAYADLDNDGDLDMVVNNINDSLLLYRNNLSAITPEANFLEIELTGPDKNRDAIGAQIEINTSGKFLFYNHSIFRGYLSSHGKKAHFGLGQDDLIDEIKIVWPDNSISILESIDANQTLKVDYNSSERSSMHEAELDSPSLIKKDTSFLFSHLEEDYIDYNIQPLLPHKLSQYGPPLTVGDINMDGLDDLYIGGSTFFNGFFIIQKTDGSYTIDSLLMINPDTEEQGALIFDADSDGFNDMIVITGSYEIPQNDDRLKDVFLKGSNDGLQTTDDVLPGYLSNATNIAGADFDRDGDIDLFICGRVMTGSYPRSAASFLLENISERGSPKFALSDRIQGLEEIGMVTDALWTDYNNDDQVDLILTRELDEVLFLKNESGTFLSDTPEALKGKKGFWNSVTGGDIDRDGDIDYVFGNLGTNTYATINHQYPYRIYVNDFDKNGSEDALPFAYLRDRQNKFREFPTVSRMDFAKEINSVRKMWPSYKLYAQADVGQIITKETMSETDIYEANYVNSIVLWNHQDGFECAPLPDNAQLAPIYGTVILDVNDDGYEDIVAVGNDYGTELVFGRMDALNGLVLLGGTNQTFNMSHTEEDAFYVSGDGKSLSKINWSGSLSLITGENKGDISKFDLAKSSLQTVDQNVQRVEYYAGESVWTQEVYMGGGFLSQHTQSIVIPEGVRKINLIRYNGEVEERLIR